MSDIAIGLMSGTSCDGVSAAAVAFSNRRFKLLAEHTYPYPSAFRRRLQHAAALSAPEISSLNVELGTRFAQSVRRLLGKARLTAGRVAVIGSHGHTLYHGPRDRIASTWQIGEPSIIALETGIPVISNFRAADIAAGGEGAPLVPYFDAYFFGGGPPRALVNVGGIANISIVGRGLRPIAFDTGPGNTLLDRIAVRISRGRARYDRNGSLAAQGAVDLKTLQRMQSDPYFHRKPPKSTGKEYFNDEWLNTLASPSLRRRPVDLLATATALTAVAIAEGLRRWGPKRLSEVIISGGGAYNRTLINQLTEALRPVPVRLSAPDGLPVQAKEPIAFAFLALRAFQGRPNHLPQTTGARRTCILGSLVLPPPMADQKSKIKDQRSKIQIKNQKWDLVHL